jgi:hypothetical protein
MEWMTRHKTTSRTAVLVRTLVELAREIEGSLIAGASADARAEWWMLRGKWPTERELGAGVVGVSDDQLALFVDKVLRFKTILAGLPRAELALAA